MLALSVGNNDAHCTCYRSDIIREQKRLRYYELRRTTVVLLASYEKAFPLSV